VKRIVVLTTVMLIGLLLLQRFLSHTPDERNWEFFPDMGISAAYRPQSSNPHFSDGKTQQHPVAGSIARGYMPFGYGTSTEEIERAGRELRSPFTTGEAPDPERGETVWNHYCQVCHGADGGGAGPVTKRGYPRPPSLLSGRVRGMQDGQIFHIVTTGYRNMPSYGSQIKRQDRWQVIEHMRKLQENQP
jgi:cytochrome c5